VTGTPGSGPGARRVRRRTVRTTLQVAGVTAALVAVYYLLPLDHSSTGVAVTTWQPGWSCSSAGAARGHRPDGPRSAHSRDRGQNHPRRREHELLVEARTKAEARHIYPACAAGEGACPPEDAGGYPGYQQLKEILADPSNEEYEEMRAWADSQVRGDFDPASLDLAQASARVSIA
jgi:Plasmid pRiA4b ORF-3-like protein